MDDSTDIAELAAQLANKPCCHCRGVHEFDVIAIDRTETNRCIRVRCRSCGARQVFNDYGNGDLRPTDYPK